MWPFSSWWSQPPPPPPPSHTRLSSSSSSSLHEPLLREASLRCKVVLLGDTGVGKTSLAVRFVRNDFREFEATTGGTFLARKLVLEETDVSKNDAAATATTGTAAPVAAAPKAVRFHIWDTAGQDRFRPIAPLYYKGASAAIVVYDVTNPSSLETARSWIEELSEPKERQKQKKEEKEKAKQHSIVVGDDNKEEDDDDDEIAWHNSENDTSHDNADSNNNQDGNSLVLALVGNKIDLAKEPTTRAFEEAELYASDMGILHLGTSAKTSRNVQQLFVALARRLPVVLPPEGHETPRSDRADDTSPAESPARRKPCCYRWLGFPMDE